MGEVVKDKRVVTKDGDNFLVERTIQERFDAETFLRTITSLEVQQKAVKKAIREVDRKIIQQIRAEKKEQLKEIERILVPLKNWSKAARKVRDKEVQQAKKDRENGED